MLIHFNTKEARNIPARIVEELPEIGGVRCPDLPDGAEIIAVEPCPYRVPQPHFKNYLYAVWRVVYRTKSSTSDGSVYVAIHEKEAEEI